MKARQMAMGGVFAALAVVLLFLGGIIPIGTFAGPMLASLLLLPLRRDFSAGLCVGWYAVVSVLGVGFCPDRETAFFFVFLGWYPIIKPKLDRLRFLPRAAAKLLVFNAAIATLYAVLIFLFQLEAVLRELRETAGIWLILMLLLGNGTFLLYDFLLSRLRVLMEQR